jgi:hypothetical protein
MRKNNTDCDSHKKFQHEHEVQTTLEDTHTFTASLLGGTSG